MNLDMLLCPDCFSPNVDQSVWVSTLNPEPSSLNGRGECLDKVYCNSCDTEHKAHHCHQLTINLEESVLLWLKHQWADRDRVFDGDPRPLATWLMRWDFQVDTWDPGSRDGPWECESCGKPYAGRLVKVQVGGGEPYPGEEETQLRNKIVCPACVPRDKSEAPAPVDQASELRKQVGDLPTTIKEDKE